MLRIAQSSLVRGQAAVMSQAHYSIIPPQATEKAKEIYEKTAEAVKSAAGTVKEAVQHGAENLGLKQNRSAQEAADAARTDRGEHQSKTHKNERSEKISEYAKRMDEETDRTRQTRV